MSRIGKKLITIPKGVTVSFNGRHCVVKGPKGQLEYSIPEPISFQIEGDVLTFSRGEENEKHIRALHGLVRALIANMIEGVNTGFTRVLNIEGVGYKVEMRGQNLLMTMGYSHPVLVVPPKGVTIAATTATQVSVTGIDKQLVGEVAAVIRKVRPPEPYKGKGIRYEGEYIVRKAGKSGSK